MKPLRFDILPPTQISAQDVLAMFSLYDKFYDCTNFELFQQDLNQKTVVLIIFDQDKIIGFTTILQYKTHFQNKELQIIFSGDTIMHEQYWGNPILAFAWLKFAGSIKSKNQNMPLYWFIIVKGHRTYRYLPAFSKAFYPNCETNTPTYEQALIEHLATHKFGDAYQADKGILHFAASKGQIKQAWADIPENLLQRKDIKFFYEKNPNYANGDELVCLCELCESNLKPLSKRIFKQGYTTELCTTS